ncbi:MAG: hypothetical protein GY861_04205, partial [bacterium]|nr:hypothetical protein [bacterium]
GVDVSFRNEGTSLFINVKVPETLPELQAIPGWEKMDLSGCQYSGKNDFKFTSAIDPTKFLNATLEEIVEMATKFSVEGNSNFEELHHVLTAVTNFAKDLLPDSPDMRMALALVPILTAPRKFCFEFKYDPNTIKNTIKGVMLGSGKHDKVTDHLTNKQTIANEFFPQAQEMAPMFLGPYSDLLKNVNLGHYEFFVMVPR